MVLLEVGSTGILPFGDGNQETLPPVPIPEEVPQQGPGAAAAAAREPG